MYSVFCVTHSAVTCIGHFVIHAVTKKRMKSRTRFLITPKIVDNITSFMLILVGHDERSFSLQINITKVITSIVQCG